ncbi:MAG: ATPase, T2SS/T4P/T4SS family [Candidatus Diapherotrites archaeon]|nr:ATPase, T2SS/T4P/T4SS family [Candidatus Diapherotrites archaeon]
MNYTTRDCSNCLGLGDISFEMCKACIKPSKETELLVYKNKLFTKQHYLADGSYVIFPFFVDCLIKPVKGNVLQSYAIKDSSVKIIQEQANIEPTYAISIPNLDLNINQLVKLYNDYDAGDFKDPLLLRWIKKHGILDYLMNDSKIQEININPPEFQSPFRIVHEDYDECRTNIFPSIDLLNYLATHLKIESGRPLNKAQPQLDAELFIDKQRARVAAVVPPFSIHGIGYSIRRHRENPWTLPLFISNNTINPLFAGLMSFLITHGRTMMFAGPRGSGKTSLLGATVLEILPKYRIITIEDEHCCRHNPRRHTLWCLRPCRQRLGRSKGLFQGNRHNRHHKADKVAHRNDACQEGGAGKRGPQGLGERACFPGPHGLRQEIGFAEANKRALERKIGHY